MKIHVIKLKGFQFKPLPSDLWTHNPQVQDRILSGNWDLGQPPNSRPISLVSEPEKNSVEGGTVLAKVCLVFIFCVGSSRGR